LYLKIEGLIGISDQIELRVQPNGDRKQHFKDRKQLQKSTVTRISGLEESQEKA